MQGGIRIGYDDTEVIGDAVLKGWEEACAYNFKNVGEIARRHGYRCL